MKQNKLKTHLVCYDDFRWFSEDVRSRFDDIAQYNINSFLNVEEFMSYFEKNTGHKYCRIAILGAHDTTEHFEMVGRLAREIKMMDPETGIILICTPDKTDEIKKIISEGIDSYIAKNSNVTLRLHNAVKKLISEHQIKLYKQKRNRSLMILAGAVVLILVLAVLAWFKLPETF